MVEHIEEYDLVVRLRVVRTVQINSRGPLIVCAAATLSGVQAEGLSPRLKELAEAGGIAFTDSLIIMSEDDYRKMHNDTDYKSDATDIIHLTDAERNA